MQSSASWCAWSQRLEVVRVVGREQRQPQVGRHLQQLGVHAVLRPGCRGAGARGSSGPGRCARTPRPAARRRRAAPPRMRARDQRGEAARGRDQPLAVLAQQVEVDARLVVEALEVALRDQLHQVAVAGVVHRDQQLVADRVEAARVALARLLVEARARRRCRSRSRGSASRRPRAPSRRTRPRRTGCRGRSSRWLSWPSASSALEQRVVLDGAVEQRVLRVQVQVGERDARPRYSHSIVAGGFDETS